ncbi:MAG TPA: hypothetical protein VM869_04735 [Enhygromyxa sp.]|nr:hypothetical protein [Enhygromyxa sp.]
MVHTLALISSLSALLGLGPAPEARTDAPDAGKSAPAPLVQESADAAAGSEPDATEQAVAVAPEQIIDAVLPCGLRVIAAKDASLPVAAVVLSIEVGTRDDPDKLPGLVHALAYHLQQGNRELGPGEAIATTHDVGGIVGMAVGPAQVRFESLVPISALDAQLRVESLRLRAPNTGRELWLKSLSYARNDDDVKLVVPREAAAAAWDDPGLAHDGRIVGQGLGDMLDQSVGAQLARLFDYRNATLVVVGPDDPQALLARVEPLFADLPARSRKPTASTIPPKPAAARTLALPRQNGDTIVWAVAGTPQARAWAQVLCGTLNRQKRGVNDPPKSRVRCTYDDDPRRPLLVVRAIGFDVATGPEPMIAERLARVADANAEPELAALIEDQRARVEQDLAYTLRAPLELAGYLASTSEAHPGGQPLRERGELLGLPSLPDPTEQPGVNAATLLVAAIPQLLDTNTGVLLLSPEAAQPQPDTPAQPDAAAQPDTPETPEESQ